MITLTATIIMDISMNTNTSDREVGDLALLGLMQFISPALPIGAFAWSQGLESAFELGWVKNEEELGAWLEGVLDDGLSRCELPVLARLYHSWANRDCQEVTFWNDWLLANRETSELCEEDIRLGQALIDLLTNLEMHPQLHVEGAKQLQEPGYVTMFAWVTQLNHIPVRQSLLGFAWGWLENQLAVACKALPLGHTAAQRLCIRLQPKLVEAVESALSLEDWELGPTLPGLALGSAKHETQYSRLFRS
ncbi:TPA: urease accessory UreF family protein [Vibrio campbellii]|uniref:urease accessory protein UreF n=2 Tax=Vibrio campbellii TaxID=680 RepID=UPI001E55DE8F|nr:urease accessory UreF family protein [Vibrio campbellii]